MLATFQSKQGDDVKYVYYFLLITSPFWVALFVLGVISLMSKPAPDEKVMPIVTRTNVYSLAAATNLNSLVANCRYTNKVAWVNSKDYAEGINDALDTFMLLSLEQRLMNTNRTLDEMAMIVCERMKVKRTELGKPK